MNDFIKLQIKTIWYRLLLNVNFIYEKLSLECLTIIDELFFRFTHLDKLPLITYSFPKLIGLTFIIDQITNLATYWTLPQIRTDHILKNRN